MAFDFCIPTRSTIVPDGPDWLHEVKYDGYRLRLERDGDSVRLITRGGLDDDRDEKQQDQRNDACDGRPHRVPPLCCWPVVACGWRRGLNSLSGR